MRVSGLGLAILDLVFYYFFGLRDMRWSASASFTRITDPAEITEAASLCYTSFNSLPNARTALNTRCGAWSEARAAGQYVSDLKGSIRLQGRLRPGGYAAWLP